MDDCRCCDNFSGDVSAGNMGKENRGRKKKSILKNCRQSNRWQKQRTLGKKNGTTAEKK